MVINKNLNSRTGKTRKSIVNNYFLSYLVLTDSDSDVSAQKVTKRSRKKSLAKASNCDTDDEEEIPPLNFEYVAKRWQKEASQGIDKRISDPVKAIIGSAKWLVKIPYQYWCTIFDSKKRKDPFGKSSKNDTDNPKTSWTTTVRVRLFVCQSIHVCTIKVKIHVWILFVLQVLGHYWDGNRKGPFATKWYQKHYKNNPKSQSDACALMEQPIGRLFDNGRTRGLSAALVIKLLGKL